MTKKREPLPGGPVNTRDLAVKFVIDEVSVVEWCPGDNAVLPPEQVHILVHIPGIDGFMAIRLKTRAVAESLIDALRVHTDGVWPIS